MNEDARTQILTALALAAAPRVYEYALERFTDEEIPMPAQEQFVVSFEELKKGIYETAKEYASEELPAEAVALALKGYEIAVEALKKLYKEKTTELWSNTGASIYLKQEHEFFDKTMGEFLELIRRMLTP